MWALPGEGEERKKLELKPVLVVMDLQNIWFPLMAEEDRNSAPQKINESIALFREFGHPIIRVYHSDPKHGPEPNTEPFEFPDSIATTDDDYKILCERLLGSLEDRVRDDFGASLEISEEAREGICANCTHQEEGARGFRKVFDRILVGPLISYIRENQGEVVIRVGWEKDSPNFSI